MYLKNFGTIPIQPLSLVPISCVFKGLKTRRKDLDLVIGKGQDHVTGPGTGIEDDHAHSGHPHVQCRISDLILSSLSRNMQVA